MKALLLFVLTLIQTQQESTDLVKQITCSNTNEYCAYFYSNRFSIYHKDSLTREVYLDDQESELIKQYRPIFVESKLYFIEHFGGKVLVLNGGILKRIDNSFTHRSQLLSSIFTYKGGIYRFGGYGFFDARNFITKYNFNSNEWDVIQIKGDDLPPGLFDSKSYLLKNELYILGGKKVDNFDRNTFENSNAIWKFNLESEKWSYLGEFNFIENLLHKNNDFIFENKLFFLEGQKVYSFDPLSSVINEIQNLPLQDKIDSRFPIVIIENQIQYFTRSNNEKSLLIKNNVPASSLKQVINKIEKVNQQSRISRYTFPLFLLTFVACFAIIIFSKKRRVYKKQPSWNENDLIYLTDRDLIYKDSKVHISDQEKSLIHLLLSQSLIQTDELLEIFSEVEVTHSQKLRMKNELIFRLNIKFQILCNTRSTMIKQIQSPKDKRILIYSLNIKNIKTI